MSAGFHLLDRVERFGSHIREHFHDHHDKEFIMKFLDDLIAKAKSLAEPDAALTARAEKAEADLAALQAQVADDEAKAKAALDVLNGSDQSTGAFSGQTTGQGATASQPVVGQISTTVQGQDGSATTLDHTSGTASTTDASGASIATDQAAADAAKAAATAAGITVANA